MNVTKLITTLQKVANTATTAAEYAALSKSVEKLELGKVVTVSTTANLPTNLTTNGNVYFVSSDEDLYYNVGSTWKLFYDTGRAAYAWGNNLSGRLGDNTTVSKRSPVTVVGSITNWSQLSAGYDHSLGITTTGIAYGWGYNNYGRLGDDTTSHRSSPVTVVGGITNWNQVSAGRLHSLGLTTSGIAYAWGVNASGELGDNTTVSKRSPVTVVGSITNWSQLSAGRSTNLGLTLTGILYGWGYNNFGQLGDNTIITKSSPVLVIGGIINWSLISAVGGGGRFGSGHSLGLTTSGIAYAWGVNASGELGDNTTSSRTSPVTVVGGITNWSRVSAGGNHSLGLTTSGIAYGWGYNDSGRLGDNTTSSRTSPVTVAGGITNWSLVSAGSNHSMGLTLSGIAYGWGYNGSGRLGDNTTSNRSSPVTIVGSTTSWLAISSGSSHTLATSTVIL